MEYSQPILGLADWAENDGIILLIIFNRSVWAIGTTTPSHSEPGDNDNVLV